MGCTAAQGFAARLRALSPQPAALRASTFPLQGKVGITPREIRATVLRTTRKRHAPLCRQSRPSVHRAPVDRALRRASAAGFSAVELQFPYDIAPSAVTAELKRHGLTQLGVNTPQCPEFGLAALPGRERDWDAAFKRALDYVVAIGGSAIHCMTGTVPPEQRPAAETVFVKNLERAAADAAKANITLLIEPINQRDRPGYFLSSDRARRRRHRQGRRAECAHSVRFLSRADHERRSAQALRKILPRHRPRAGRRGADAAASPTKARSIIPPCSKRSTAPAMRAGSAANTSHAPAPKTGSAGPENTASCRKGAKKCVWKAKPLW